VTGKPPAPRQPHIVDPDVPPVEPTGRKKPVSSGEAADEAASRTSEKETNLYAVKEPQGSGNPYQWDFDLCSQNSAISTTENVARAGLRGRCRGGFAGPGVRPIFSLQPRAAGPAPAALPCAIISGGGVRPDANVAVARARKPRATSSRDHRNREVTDDHNLIADFVARGKRVLFVCEKRAAIDVVFHRLRRQDSTNFAV